MAVFLRPETVFVRKIVTRCTLFETYFNLQKTILSTTPPDSNCKHARTAGIFDAENVCALQQKPFLHFPSRCLTLGKQKTQTKYRSTRQNVRQSQNVFAVPYFAQNRHTNRVACTKRRQTDDKANASAFWFCATSHPQRGRLCIDFDGVVWYNEM